ncbi:S-adenosyl-L-methionine-dependent methyltransferase [Cladochytrium replicatum]|nr:S-adenosyl-L-methionine-dependent methyltransferase [Cladochytrium replicatum]
MRPTSTIFRANYPPSLCWSSNRRSVLAVACSSGSPLRSQSHLPGLAPPQYSTTAPIQPNASTSGPVVFNRYVKKLQRDRASGVDSNVEKSRQADYLKDEVAERVVDRLLDIKRRFGNVLDLGSGAGHIVKCLTPELVQRLTMLDSSEKILNRDAELSTKVPVTRVLGDEESLLEHFPESSFDAVLSNMSLHWVNDLPGALIQARKVLKPDCAFIGAILGNDTLYELRTSLQLAETERKGGIAAHVSPMTDVRDMASLLQRAGFTLTTVDVDEIVISYPSMFELLEDLQQMGENNAILNRAPLSRDVLLSAASIYKAVYGNEDGSIPATFDVIYMIGWSPDPSQPKPKERGSATVSLKNTLENNS